MRSLQQIIDTDHATPAEMAEYGITREEFAVVRFLDADESKRWFYRDHESLGMVSTLAEGGRPLNPTKVLAVAREACGEGTVVLW